MDSLTLKTRILVPLIVVCLVVFSVGGYFVNNLAERQKNDAVLHEAEAMQSYLKSVLATKAEVMEASLRFIAQDKQLLAAMQAGDRNALLALSIPIYKRLHEQNNVTHFYFHDAHRVNLRRAHNPEKHGDGINRYTAVGAEKTGAMYSGMELGPLGTFAMRSVLPVFNGGHLLGYLELGQEVDGLIQDVRSMFHIELFMLIEKQFLKRDEWEAGMRMLGRPFDWNMLSDAVLISQSLPEAPISLLDNVAHAHDETLMIAI
ncbi:MAG: cache domain-containing protein, partial [Gallionellaceae bacterium]|nr:cache domain-containing protein [Gallionellaceae bacterium]